MRPMVFHPCAPKWRRFWLVLALSSLAACGGDDVAGPDDPPNPAFIGPEGGTVTGADGSRITVPAGALDQEVALTVAGFADPGDLPAAAALMPLAGVFCGPDGQTFASPVTVTFTAREALTPGARIPLHTWCDTAGGWVATPFTATVREDGSTLDADVTHFSCFGGLPGSEGLLADIDGMLCAGAAAAVIIGEFQVQFREEVAAVGDHGIWDQECREVVGLDWDLHATSGGTSGDRMEFEGDVGTQSLTVGYQVECSTGDSPGNTLDATITIHHACSPPDLLAAADPACIEAGGSSTVTATLHCGELPYPGQDLQFECFGPGQIAADAVVTNPAGQAQTMYTNDGEPGTATVRAYHDACAGTEQASTVTDDAVITIGGDWQGVLHVAFHQEVGDGPLGVFQDAVTITFAFTTAEGTVTGTGMLIHAPQIWPGDEDCWLDSIDAPPFPVVIAGTTSAQTVQLQFVPSGMIPLSFVIMCDPDDPSEYPYPAHGLLEGAALTLDIQPILALADGATAEGSGSQDFGDDMPLVFDWNVTINLVR